MATLKLPPGTQITMPDGRKYTTGEQPVTTNLGKQPATRADVQKALDASQPAQHAIVGAAVMKEAAKRAEVIKALEDAADRWTAAAMAEPSSTSELRRYWLSKAASARSRANELRQEK